MRSRCAKVCKHLLSIAACAIALGVPASEVAVESIRPDAVVQLEPNNELAPPAPLADAEPRAKEETEKALAKTEPRTPKDDKQPDVPAERTRHEKLDHRLEQAVRKDYSGIATPLDSTPASLPKSAPPHVRTDDPKSSAPKNVADVPRRTSGKVSLDELFQPKTHQEPLVVPPNPLAPREQIATARQTEPISPKSKTEPSRVKPEQIVVSPPMPTPPKSKPNTEPAKVEAGQIVVSPPAQMNPKTNWDEVFDKMVLRQPTAAAPPTPKVQDKVVSARQEVPASPKKSSTLDSEEASTAPPFVALPTLPQFPPLENDPPQPAPVPTLAPAPAPKQIASPGTLPEFPPIQMERTSLLPSLPMMPSAPEFGSTAPLIPSEKMPSLPVFGPIQQEAFPSPTVRKDNPPSALPPVVPVRKDGPRTPSPSNVANQLLKENFIGLPKALPALPSPPTQNASVPIVPVTEIVPGLPTPPVIPALPANPAMPAAGPDVCDNVPPIWIDPPTAEPPPVVKLLPKNTGPAWLANGFFSTALPQTPRLVSQRTFPDSVFGSNQEKAENLVSMRKMIAAAKIPADKEITVAKLPPLVPDKKDLPRMVGDPPVPPLPIDNAVLPAKAVPVDNAVLLAKLPDPIDSAVKQAGGDKNDTSKVVQTAAQDPCPNCARPYPNNGVGGLPPSDLLESGRCVGCGRGDCVPGRKKCIPCESNTILGGFLCDLYECICCPDPCYEGKWIAQADAAFFVDAARPQSQMRFTYEGARHILFPDRSEYFWARADGQGSGPNPTPHVGEARVRYDELTMYTEAAVGGVFSTFISYPYLSVDPDFAPHAAGFGDLSIGTKTLLFDCELLQVSFQMKTTIPTGSSMKGLGTGHVSLEPSLLFALKLSRDTYFQGQLGEWIPIGGNTDYAGSIFETRFSLNHVLCRILPDVPLLATLESNTLTFQHGQYTDPDNGPNQKSSGATYVTMGPGLRLVVCDRIDFGLGSQFALTTQHFAQTLVRVEFRFRY